MKASDLKAVALSPMNKHEFDLDSDITSTESYEQDQTIIDVDKLKVDIEKQVLNEDNSTIDVNPQIDEHIDENTSLLDRIKILLSRSIPIIISFLLGIGGGFINLMFAGTYSDNETGSVVFAGVSLANLFANVSYLSILIGLLSLKYSLYVLLSLYSLQDYHLVLRRWLLSIMVIRIIKKLE